MRNNSPTERASWRASLSVHSYEICGSRCADAGEGLCAVGVVLVELFAQLVVLSSAFAAAATACFRHTEKNVCLERGKASLVWKKALEKARASKRFVGVSRRVPLTARALRLGVGASYAALQ